MRVVNLNKMRKVLDRADGKRKADENAVKHGRTKAQRLLEAARSERARRALDGAKFEE